MIKENEMVGACRTRRKDDKCTQQFDWKTRREETTQKTYT